MEIWFMVIPQFSNPNKMGQTGGQYHTPNKNGGHFKIQDELIFIHQN
jgi:hypothetical protein